MPSHHHRLHPIAARPNKHRHLAWPGKSNKPILLVGFFAQLERAINASPPFLNRSGCTAIMAGNKPSLFDRQLHLLPTSCLHSIAMPPSSPCLHNNRPPVLCWPSRLSASSSSSTTIRSYWITTATSTIAQIKATQIIVILQRRPPIILIRARKQCQINYSFSIKTNARSRFNWLIIIDIVRYI